MTQAGPPPVCEAVVHAPLRLRVCAFLDAVSSAEFSALRDVLEVADSVVSKHLKVLTDAGYVKLEKPTGRGRVRTGVRLTDEGRAAYRGHVAELRSITADASRD